MRPFRSSQIKSNQVKSKETSSRYGRLWYLKRLTKILSCVKWLKSLSPFFLLLPFKCVLVVSVFPGEMLVFCYRLCLYLLANTFWVNVNNKKQQSTDTHISVYFPLSFLCQLITFDKLILNNPQISKIYIVVILLVSDQTTLLYHHHHFFVCLTTAYCPPHLL